MTEQAAETITPPEEKDEAPTAAPVEPPKESRPPPRTRTRSARRPAGRPPKVPDLEDRLVEFFGKVETSPAGVPYCTGVAGLAWVFDQNDGAIIAMHSQNMAKAWANLASQNERVKRALEFMLSGSAWGEVFFASSPVILGILANHGVTLASFGLGSPEPELGEQPESRDDGTSPDGSVEYVPPGL